MRGIVVIAAALGVLSVSTAQAANRPAGYTTICSENKTCSVSATTNVAFGRANQFIYKSLNGSFVCNEATFGGRIAGGVNECSVPPSGASSSATSSSSSSSSVASSSSSKSSSSSSVASSSSSSSVASSSSSSAATTSKLDLSRYTLSTSVALGSTAAEASAVTWNWDTDTLFVLGDEGKAIVQISKAGVQLNSMTLSGFEDTEGLTYIGNGQFVITEERLQDAYVLTYTAGGKVTRSSLASVSIGSTVDNIGIEGISYDRLSGKYFAVKEKDSQAVHDLTINFATKSITVKSLFSPSLLGLADLSDIQTLGSVTALDTTGKLNLLIVSQESAELLEVTRSGSIVSRINLAGISTDIEGVTIDSNGTIYLVAQSPRLYVLKPR
ncbi:MAG: SdiA-regulated domain-containing protein [Rhodocyclaceae bacterium]